MKISSYPKIFSLGQDYIRDIFADEVVVEEKLDGSQYAFGLVEGVLYIRSKGAQIHPEDVKHSMFKLAVDQVVALHERGLLPDGTIYYCEYLSKPKHNVLTYSRVPKNNLMLFGMIQDGSYVASRSTLVEHASRLDIDVVPQLWTGRLHALDSKAAIEHLKSFMALDSYLGGCKIEGVVVKNYSRPFLLGGQPIPLMAGKYVSEAFKEVHSKVWNGENTSRGKWDGFIDAHRTEARWSKAAQWLAERGEATNSPKDIGKLIARVKQDIEEEEKENIKNFLWKEFGGDLLRRSTAGLPEWWKTKLLERSVEATSEAEVLADVERHLG